MTKRDLKRGLRKIQAMENELMRELTEEEINLLMSNGDESLVYDHLGMDDDDLVTLRNIRQLISTWCTLPEDEFDELVKTIDVSAPYFVLRTVANALEEVDKKPVSDTKCTTEEKCTCPKERKRKESGRAPKRDATDFLTELLSKLFAVEKDVKPSEDEKSLGEAVITDIIDRLKKGEEVDTGSEELTDEIVEKLWNEYSNITIKTNNNKIKVKF